MHRNNTITDKIEQRTKRIVRWVEKSKKTTKNLNLNANGIKIYA